MSEKFDKKTFVSKRIERAVKNNPGVSRIWVWSNALNEYSLPPRGRPYIASHKVKGKVAFTTLQDAQCWMREIPVNTDPKVTTSGSSAEITFNEVIGLYKKEYFPTLNESTQGVYDHLLGKYFEPLKPVKMSDFTASTVDSWIEYLKELPRKSIRSAFKKEFNLLSGLLKLYSDYDDDFENPIKPRHRRNIKLQTVQKPKDKFMTEEQFLSFKSALVGGLDGELFAAIATVQFYQALRIGEVMAISWDDLKFDAAVPSRSVLTVSKSIYFPRSNMPPRLRDGFKNSKTNEGSKALVLFKETYEVLQELKNDSQNGLIFQKGSDLWTFRQITYRYEQALKKAALPFKGTHFMRHGGASLVYNKSAGDLSLVSMVLGNKSLKSTTVYAHRAPEALVSFANKGWENGMATPQIPTNEQFKAKNEDKG